MKSVFHAADSRGNADHGWLKSRHTFSFADYYNPGRIHFGTLRVINDDFVIGGEGFGTHPHKDMEIISIPLVGALEHKDSMGHGGVIHKGDVQVMSAGTGVTHSEFNASKADPVQFLQIWVFSREPRVSPRYQQLTLGDKYQKNDFVQIVSPDENDEGTWIHQDAWFNLCDWDKDVSHPYTVKRSGNGVYVFLIRGKIQVGEQELNTRDGYGVWERERFDIKALEASEFLVMDVPMAIPDYLR